MTFIPIQRGELTDRLRRYFGIVGRYRGDVDTLVSPVVTAQNLDIPPFRQDGTSWSGWATRLAAVGQVSHVEVGATNPNDVLVVEQITIMNQNAGAASFLIGTAAGPVTPGGLWSTENVAAGAIAAAIPGGIQAGTSGLATGTLWRITLPAVTSITLSNLALVATDTQLIRVEPAAVNLDVSATFYGRWWRYVPR